MQQDLATKEIEQRLKQEIEKQKLNEPLSWSVPVPVSEAVVGATKSGNCITPKMVTGKPYGITKIGARIKSIITVGNNLSAISPQTTSRAFRALLTRGGSKSVRVENRYTEAYSPHEVMLNIDEIKSTRKP